MSREVNAEIVSVGSELLLGQIANTNAQWISEQLAQIGVNVFFHHTVGDNFSRLESVMRLAEQRSHLVIVTGGLGPTDDDLTRDVAKEVLNQQLVINETVLEKVQHYFSKNHIVMTENNRKQALVFQGGEVFLNEVGMAPGILVKKGDTIWVFLPGVPREMKSLMTKSVLPYLVNYYKLDQIIQSKVLKFIGIGESILEDKLKDIIRSQTNPTIAPLAGEGEVTLRLTAKANNTEIASQLISKVEEKIVERVGAFCYGKDQETIEQRVLTLLQEKNRSLASAESLTGGKFIEKLIAIPGASSHVAGSIVSYQEETKVNVLQVSKSIIEQYGTVSSECAKAMAAQIQALMNTSVGISFTGNAGPDASEDKPVGKVFIGVKVANKEAEVYEFQFNGNRDTIRNRAVKKGFEILYNLLKN
ncbi:competence/damage-inducible protein A [Salirhabdus sp. Marseille-P4669]|uniref:competence/damage-inducible protein A n=1 Tax=Salirhabdus sp. Marseille-P4669 TaxID=2042310 RepID=UPI000C7D053F|nr:competence/damage-inducible protein A [Salirhabdus sp. Marseille-P4669]